MPLDPAESVFLRFIASFTNENIRDAITQDVDLGKLLLEEFEQDYITEARHWANLYDGTHPGAKLALGDPLDSARRVLGYLKINRPDLGYEIESYTVLRTGATIGLVPVSKGGQPMAPQVQEQQGHLGMTWLAKSIQSLAQVLGYL